jgi:hypothetical protein
MPKTAIRIPLLLLSVSPPPTPPTPPHPTHYFQAKDVKKASCLNLAAAALKQQEWSEAVKQATRVLDLDPDNVKARYRSVETGVHPCICVVSRGSH